MWGEEGGGEAVGGASPDLKSKENLYEEIKESLPR